MLFRLHRLVAVVILLGAATAGPAAWADALCVADTQIDAELGRALDRLVATAEVTVRAPGGCKADGARLVGHFSGREPVLFTVRTDQGEAFSRAVPWLTRPDAALVRLRAQGRLSAFSVLVEALLAEQRIAAGSGARAQQPAPAPPPAAPAPTPAAPAPTPAPPATAAPRSAARSEAPRSAAPIQEDARPLAPTAPSMPPPPAGAVPVPEPPPPAGAVPAPEPPPPATPEHVATAAAPPPPALVPVAVPMSDHVSTEGSRTPPPAADARAQASAWAPTWPSPEVLVAGRVRSPDTVSIEIGAGVAWRSLFARAAYQASALWDFDGRLMKVSGIALAAGYRPMLFRRGAWRMGPSLAAGIERISVQRADLRDAQAHPYWDPGVAIGAAVTRDLEGVMRVTLHVEGLRSIGRTLRVPEGPEVHYNRYSARVALSFAWLP